MKKFYRLFFMVVVVSQLASAQNQHSRISISQPSQNTLNLLAQYGVDLRCGVNHDHRQDNLTIDISDSDRSVLDQNGISYTTKIADLTTFYNQRAVAMMPMAMQQAQLEDARTRSSYNVMMQKSGSITDAVLDNYLQYAELEEKEWTKPINFELGSMGGCYTISEVLSELDDMRAYSQTNGLNIVSAKQDASSSGITTWGNPSGTINNNGLTYTGQGNTRWNPQTMYYVRITGNESSTAEGSKPQMLFTSMIHSREVSALMNNMYFMWYIIENYNSDNAIKELVDNNELYFIPVVNPDGLRWNEHLNSSGGGMQRKNLRPNTGGTSNSSANRGVDLNRNFDYFWGTAGSGSSGVASQDSYRGPSPESEPETQIIVEFVQSRNFKTAIWNHSWANSIPHPYGGNPNFVSGREDEMHEMHSDMTKYNRYVSGATIFSPSNGIADDWMLGGNADANGSIGSGKNVLATTPEHGGLGFWPTPTEIIPIAKRSIRISLMGAYYGGKYAKFHDLTQSDITSLTSTLDFALERIGQTPSSFTLNITPISTNITNIVSPATQTGMSILEQRNLNGTIELDPSIQPNDKIEYKVQLSNDEGVFYDVNVVKYYQPTVIFFSDAQAGFSDWSNSGWNRPSTGGYTGSRVFRTGNSVPYANNTTKTLTSANSYDFSSSNKVLVQFYAKWDIERNFDLVELQASTDGSNWVTLNGKYSKPKSSSSTNDHALKSTTNEAFQGNNSSGHIYDGDQMDNWVMEEIIIDDSNNSTLLGSSTVSFRFRMRSDGDNQFENYSANAEGFFFDDFKVIGITIPCATDVPTSLNANSITASSATLDWASIPSATFDVRYRVLGVGTWTEVTDLASSSYVANSLTAETNYEFQVRSKCGASASEYSDSTQFTTSPISYCNSQGNNSSYEYISRVQLNTIDNSSNAQGYSDFTNVSTTLLEGQTYTITITPDWQGQTYSEAYSVWIDYNKDGDFNDTGEQVWSQGLTQNTPVSGSFTIPADVFQGYTRMRVSMKYNGNPTSCETFNYGEVEDYTVRLFDGLLYSNNAWTPNAPSNATADKNVLIEDGTYAVNTDIEVNSITVDAGATINIEKTASIISNGSILNNGDINMFSDSDEYSSLVVEGTVTGDVVYNRHVNSVANGNDLVAPPVSGQIFTDFLSDNTNIHSNTAQTLYLFGPFEKPTNEYQIYSNTESAQLNLATGYRAASTDNGTFAFTGNVNTSAVTIPIQKAGSTYDKWNLVGNPYTSYIKLHEFLLENLSNLDSQSVAIYGYDSDDTDGSIWTILNLANTSVDAVIAPGQGFFISSKDGGADINFTPAMRATGNSDDFISGRNDNTLSNAIITMTSDSESFSTDLYFNENTTLGLDVGYDAEHFNGAPSGYSIFTKLASGDLDIDVAIQAISSSDIESTTTIPLGINLSQGQQVTISMEAHNLDHDIYLEDTQTNTFTLLNTTDYTFIADADLSGSGRFYLVFGQTTLSDREESLETVEVYSDNNRNQIVVKGQLHNDTQFKLYDVQGRAIYSTELSASSLRHAIDTANYSQGIYLIELSNTSHSKTQKVVIK